MHNIIYKIHPKNTTRETMLSVATKIAREDGDGYSSRFTLHSGVVYDCEDDAIEAIEGFDNGWYDDHAVLFRDLSTVKKTREIENLEERLTKLREEKRAFEKDSSVSTRSSEFIGCPCCGSKLARTRLRSNTCPLCATDLRSETTLKRLSRYNERIKEVENKILEAKKKQKNSAPVMWLQKIEYHS